MLGYDYYVSISTSRITFKLMNSAQIKKIKVRELC